MKAELDPADFAACIGVKLDDLAALERAGLPFVARKKNAHRYEIPAAITWYVEHAVSTRAGGIPARTTQKELAALTGYGPRQLTNLVEIGKLHPVVEGGRRLYPLPQANLEIIAHKEELARGRSDKKMSPLDEAKLRKLDADAQASELTLLERRGELVDRLLVERALSELLQGLLAQLMQFGPAYEADLVGLTSRKEVRQVLRPAVHKEIDRLRSAAEQVGRRIQMLDAVEDAEPEGEEGADADDAS